MPQGLPRLMIDGVWDLSPTREAKLGEDKGYLSPEQRNIVTDWWLEVVPRANTPNWDIASTCRINGKRGVLLVEAKAHDRFAWTWKLASLGVPVVLIYLGFLHAEDMADRGNPIENHEAWSRIVKAHSQGLVPETVWDTWLRVNQTPMGILLRTVELKLG